MYKKMVIAILAGIFVLLSGVARAQMTDMTVAVDGMACPFCAFGVEKRLRKVKGVATVTVDMKTGTAQLAVKPGESIRYQDVPARIKEAGFTAGIMQVTVIGTIISGNNVSFSLQFDGQSFPLESDNTTMARQLRTHAASGQTVRLLGRLHAAKGENWRVTPKSIEAAAP